MHRAIRVIFLLKSPIAATPYHRKIKSYPSSDEKKTFSLLSWENLNSSCEIFWVQAVSTSPVDTVGLCINNWTQGARIPISWQVVFTLKIKKIFLFLLSVSMTVNLFLTKTDYLQNRFQEEVSLSLYAGYYILLPERSRNLHAN